MDLRFRGLGWSGCILSAYIATLVLARPVAAADIAGKIPLKAPPAAFAYDWNGAYFGGHLGYSRGHVTDTVFDPSPSAADNSFGSLYGGIQAGYNYVLPSHLLLGVEADMSFPNFLEDGTTTSRMTAQGTQVSEQIDFVATLRGRIGYAFDRWMLFGTGGFAWSQARLIETPGVSQDADKVTPTRTGWVTGAGAEFAITPDWTAQLEYLYDRLDSTHGSFPSGTGYESTINLHMVRFGLNHPLRWDGMEPAVARPSESWPDGKDWNVHGQVTFIGQGYPAFRSPYQSFQSLYGGGQFKNTTSATAFLGFRPWDGTEIYVNPELMQGSGLSDTFGMGAFPNGEAQKSGFPIPRANVARIFVRQTFGLGGEQETVDDGPNQLAGKRDVSRVTLTVGKISALDIFDNNAFSHDPRVDFLNWNMYCCGSYDLTMDKVGYTWGGAAELNQQRWAFRVGYFLLPTVSNANTFDMHIPERGQYLAEFEWRYSLFDQPGKLRFLGYLNRGTMGSYADAVALAAVSGSTPDITLTRKTRSNYGGVINAEQAITDDLGLMARASWGAGRTEKMGWTDSDESFMFGGVLKGTSWGRPNDRIGLGGVIDGLSSDARAFFAAGGLGILVGDGALSYRPEKVLESYYAYSINKWVTLTFDYQFVVDPAYNADRGPVSIFATRLHAEF